MFRTRWLNSVVAPLTVLAAVLASTGVAHAQAKPFKIVGLGEGPQGLPLPGEPARPHWIIGDATYLGLHIGAGTVQTDSANFNLAQGIITGDFGGGSPFVFCGADGDKLVTWYGRTDHGASTPGTFTLNILDIDAATGSLIVEADFIAEFVAVPGSSTGKFAGVTGSWTMYAYTEPFVLGFSDPIGYWWEGEGSLTFAKTNR
jgi:hypothetical protein